MGLVGVTACVICFMYLVACVWVLCGSFACALQLITRCLFVAYVCSIGVPLNYFAFLCWFIDGVCLCGYVWVDMGCRFVLSMIFCRGFYEGICYSLGLLVCFG